MSKRVLKTIEEKIEDNPEVKWRLENSLTPQDIRLLNRLHDKEIRVLKRLEKFQERNKRGNGK